ncbi:MAG: OmpA family protein [Saprospiraceae bacterium]|nr:OmpA family protein [Saprospiraceae bacterium]
MKQNTILWALAFLSYCPIAPAQPGLQGEYYTGRNFQKKVLTRIDSQINFDWTGKSPAPGLGQSEYSIRWTGKITPPLTGKYLFSAIVDDGLRVWIGNKLVLDAWDLHDNEHFTGTITLTGQQEYDLKVEYFNAIFEGEIQLLWQMPGEEPMLGGLFGNNLKPIATKYFSQPPSTVVQQPSAKPTTQPTPPTPKPVPAKPKPTNTATPKKKATPTEPKPEKNTPPSPAAQADTIKKYTPKNILFVKGKSTMLSGSFAELDNLAAMLQRHPSLRVTIEGHTDNVGDAEKNMTLSKERAQMVAAYLSQKGVAPERITANGYGGTRPLTTEDTPEAHAKNRRVEFIIQ